MEFLPLKDIFWICCRIQGVKFIMRGGTQHTVCDSGTLYCFRLGTGTCFVRPPCKQKFAGDPLSRILQGSSTRRRRARGWKGRGFSGGILLCQGDGLRERFPGDQGELPFPVRAAVEREAQGVLPRLQRRDPEAPLRAGRAEEFVVNVDLHAARHRLD
jgi:hypothetical protein